LPLWQFTIILSNECKDGLEMSLVTRAKLG
jgi:hypothetical protein